MTFNFTDDAIEVVSEIILQGDLGLCECRSSPFDKHDVNPPCSKRRRAIDKARRILGKVAALQVSNNRT